MVVVVAITDEAADDRLADVHHAAGLSGPPGLDPRRPDAAAGMPSRLTGRTFVVRATADNPFVDPAVVGGQVRSR